MRLNRNPLSSQSQEYPAIISRDIVEQLNVEYYQLANQAKAHET